MTQHLIVRDVAKTALEFHAQGHLSAQKDNAGSGCRYRPRKDQPHRCAVGASLNDETLNTVVKRRRNAARVMTLITDGIITTDDPDRLTHLQDVHDTWARCIGHSPAAEAAFLKAAKELAA